MASSVLWALFANFRELGLVGTTNAPKILDHKSSSEQIFSRKLPLGAPDVGKMEIREK